MLTRQNMFEPLLEALPEARPLWEAFVLQWKDVAEPPNYLFIGDLASHLTDRLEAGSTREVVAGLAVCERWLTEGDEYVREAAVAASSRTCRRGLSTGLGAVHPARVRTH
jgi:hypothetical protein